MTGKVSWPSKQIKNQSVLWKVGFGRRKRWGNIQEIMIGKREEKQIIDSGFKYQNSLVVVWCSLTLYQQCLCMGVINRFRERFLVTHKEVAIKWLTGATSFYICKFSSVTKQNANHWASWVASTHLFRCAIQWYKPLLFLQFHLYFS